MAEGGIGELSAAVEQVSQLYAEHFGFRRDSTWFLLKLQEEVGELTQAYLALTGQGRDRGRSPEQLRAAFDEEIADVLAHLLLLARHHEVDVAEVLGRKWLSRLD